jgi:hypothetical protein
MKYLAAFFVAVFLASTVAACRPQDDRRDGRDRDRDRQEQQHRDNDRDRDRR